MTRERTKPDYVAHVRDNTRRYIEELLRENVRLRGAAERVDREEADLRRKLAELRADIACREQQHQHLLDLLGAVEAQTRRSEDQFFEFEQQHSNLAALYAASYQLHASVRRAEVLL